MDQTNLDTAKTTWDLAPLFISDTDPKIDQTNRRVSNDIQAFVAKWNVRTDYLENPDVLLEALTDYEQLATRLGEVDYYFGLREALNQLDTELKAKLSKQEEFSTKLVIHLQFFTIRLSKILPSVQQGFLNDVRLAKYRHFLVKLFEGGKYNLSEPEEKILLLKAQTSFSNWVRMTQSFLSKEERDIFLDDGAAKKATLEDIFTTAQFSKKKLVRDASATVLNEIFQKHVDVATQELNSILMDKKVDDELRKYDRPDKSRHIDADIDSEIIDVLLSTVEQRFDQSKRYYELKAKLLGLQKLDYHERNLSYGQVPDNYSYEMSVKLVFDVLNALDPEFGNIFGEFVNSGRFDVFPKKGKFGGAFCAQNSITSPVYVLLNHTNSLEDVRTIAHEMGHALNTEYMKKVRGPLDFSVPLATAEVASTFFEDFVLQKLYATADDETMLSILLSKLNDDISAIHRQLACYKFEQNLHQAFREKGYLSKEDIGAIFKKHMVSYMGEAVVQNPGTENWWVYWTHIRNFFSVFSYASGLLISKSLQNSVKKDPTFIVKVKEFLSAGTSDSPKNIFAKLGIDITDKTFWENGLKEIDVLLDQTEQLAKKLGKL